MKPRAYLVGVVLTVAWATGVHAGSANGTVYRLELYSNSPRVAVALVNGAEDRAPCATNPNGFQFAFDGSTDVGRKMYAGLLASQRAGSIVIIGGTGACTYPELEDVAFVQ